MNSIDSYDTLAFDEQSRSARRALFLAGAIAASLLGGCAAQPLDETEIDIAALTSQSVYAGTTTRTLTTECATVCTGYYYSHPKPGLTTKHCAGYKEDCTATKSSASLYADDAALARGEVFPAYQEGSSWEYLGCGAQAAQNVLNYYGVQMPIAEVGQWISSFGLLAGQSSQPFGSGIATLPDSLVSGLQNLLNAKAGGGTYVVQRVSDPNLFRSTIDAHVSRGNPVIILVNGGDHYQVVTGYRGYWDYHVIDYQHASNDRWISEFDMQLELSGWAKALSTGAGLATFGLSDAGGLNDYTAITIDFTPSPRMSRSGRGHF